ncbi:MAG: flippase-like domain-containing protein [Chloroflexi bacterium]|nr:flippase-like domain-containing protein [Chloroflexota bacterium]
MKIKRQFVFALWILLLFVGIIVFLWSIRSVPFADIVRVLSNLQVWKIIVLLMVNIAILLVVPLRWWLILRAQGYRISYLPLSGYRLAASAVSYFTPGQNFGGEPLQVISLRKHHKISGSAALASVALDRAIELFGNFTVLALGIAYVTATGLLSDFELQTPLLIALLALITPVAYLVLLWFGARPLGGALKRFQAGLVKGVINAEELTGRLIREKPLLFVEGLAASALVWVALFYEFWLALDFLGLRLDLAQLVLVVTAGRIALLAPTPGALGALEASQMLAVQALGFDSAYGLGLALLIRARDILFALVGLVMGGLGLR